MIQRGVGAPCVQRVSIQRYRGLVSVDCVLFLYGVIITVLATTSPAGARFCGRWMCVASRVAVLLLEAAQQDRAFWNKHAEEKNMPKKHCTNVPVRTYTVRKQEYL